MLTSCVIHLAPKGYIEAVEARLHRMEALLGNLLQSDDPRAQALLNELIGDEDARDLLNADLRSAVSIGLDGKARRSWRPSERSSLSKRRMSGSANRNRRTSSDGSGFNPDFDPRNFNHEDASAVKIEDEDDEDELNGGESGLQLSGMAADQSTEHSTVRSPKQRKHNMSPNNNSNLNAPSVFQFQGTQGENTNTNSILHTGFAADVTQGQGGGPVNELADVVGQLSLNENQEIRCEFTTSF